MKAFFASFVAMILCLSFGISASAQTRSLGAHQLVLDDGAGNTITIQTPSSGWTGNIPFRLAIPPAGNPLAGFVNAGTVANQILYWNTTNNDWEAEAMAALGGITGTGTSGQVAFWNGTSTQTGSANFTWDNTNQLLSVGSAYQIGGSTVLADAGTNNVFLGANAGPSTTGSNNTVLGVSAGNGLTSGFSNTLIGNNAGPTLTTSAASYNNTFVGVNSGLNTSGYQNTFMGLRAGQTNTTGNTNSAFGYQADVGAAGLTNATAIGANAIVTASSTIQLGDPGVTLVNTSGAVTAGTSIGANSASNGTLYADNGIVAGGYVQSAGTLLSGFGNVTPSHTSTGIYQLVFPWNVASTTSVLMYLTVDQASGVNNCISFQLVGTTPFTVNVKVSNANTNTLTDAPFSFLAVGKHN